MQIGKRTTNNTFDLNSLLTISHLQQSISLLGSTLHLRSTINQSLQNVTKSYIYPYQQNLETCKRNFLSPSSKYYNPPCLIIIAPGRRPPGSRLAPAFTLTGRSRRFILAATATRAALATRGLDALASARARLALGP